uniref:IQ calmodulin-binding motif-containing protein 1 n=2 Tax=Trichobilharzia regenti TaxID=157069 RepID=A0AA85JVF7_TRIRE
MDKIKNIINDLQNEINENKIIPKLIELYNIYSLKQNKNHKELNNYLLNSILPLLLCNCIKQNFSQFNENWSISYQLSCFLLNLITFNNQFKDVKISTDLLKNIIESHLILLKRLQKYYHLSSIESHLIKMETSKEDCSSLIQSLLINIEKLIKHFEIVAPYLLLKSPWFLQLFISDNQDFFILLIQLFTICIELSCDSFKQLKHSIRIDILDELIYHLSIIDISKDIESLLKCFVVLLKNIPELRGTVLKRYRGIQLLLTKWLTHFTQKENQQKSDKNVTCKQLLGELIHLIDEYKKSIKEDEEKVDESVCVKKQSKKVNLSQEQAAITIQSAWRGYSERKKLKFMSKNIAKFQRHFRECQLKKAKDLEKLSLEKEFQHTISRNRHKRYRQHLESEAKLWSSLPPRLVEIAWNKKREEAATTIQRYYRGYTTRKQITSQQDYLKCDKAARIIQVYFRKYLSRRECLSTRKCIPPVNSSESYMMKKKDSEVIDKEQILRDHRRWCETHQEKIRPISQLEDIHYELQGKLDKYLRSRRISNIKNQARQVTLTRMKIDSDLLLNETTDKAEKQTDGSKTIPLEDITSPSTKTTTLNDIVNRHIQCSDIPNAFSQFSCRVQPLARFAQIEHHDMMSMMNSNKSWWNIFMSEWNKKQNDWLKLYNEKNNQVDSKTTTNNNNN